MTTEPLDIMESIASEASLSTLLERANQELLAIQPAVEELETKVAELKILKAKKQRLLALKMSVMALLDTSTKAIALEEDPDETDLSVFTEIKTKLNFENLSADYVFLPQQALEEVDDHLKQKQSLNYQIFQAVVFNGGKASTDAIKQYLVETGAKQPQTGEGFESMPLSDISSRANYLIRKGILQPLSRGVFYTTLGWVPNEAAR